MNIRFGKKLEKIRRALGLSKNRFAKLIGASGLTINLIEKENKKPTTELCIRLINAFGVPINVPGFTKDVKTKREAMGLSTTRLAKLIESTPATIYAIEKGKFPSLRVCAKIAKALNIPLEDFIEIPDANPSDTTPKD